MVESHDRRQKRARIIQKLESSYSAGLGYSLEPFHRHRCVFIHIPRTAGVAVTTTLFGNLAGGHLDAETYRFVLGEQRFESYFKFCFVRNPWDRLVSSYHYLPHSRWPDDRTWAEEHLSRYTSFGDFVRDGVATADLSQKPHFRPQSEFVCLRDGSLAVDKVFHFESLDAGFTEIAKRLGVPSVLEKKNRSERDDYRSYYEDETRDIVAEVYSQDVKLFGYSFEHSESSHAGLSQPSAEED